MKKNEKNYYYDFKLSRSGKTNEDVGEITTIQNTTVTAGNSIINGIREERLSDKNGVVKVCNFPGATIQGMQHNLVLILERNACHLILHAGTTNAESCTLR